MVNLLNFDTTCGFYLSTSTESRELDGDIANIGHDHGIYLVGRNASACVPVTAHARGFIH